MPEGARIAGKTVEAVGIAWRQNTTLMGIARKGRRIDRSLRKTVIEPGDILSVAGPPRTGPRTWWAGSAELPLADRGLSVTKETKIWAAIAVFAGAVALAALGVLELTVALGVVALAFVAMRVVPLSEFLRPDRVAGRGASGLHDPVGRGAGGVGGHRA